MRYIPFDPEEPLDQFISWLFEQNYRVDKWPDTYKLLTARKYPADAPVFIGHIYINAKLQQKWHPKLLDLYKLWADK